jgi:hypothetical protein
MQSSSTRFCQRCKLPSCAERSHCSLLFSDCSASITLQGFSNSRFTPCWSACDRMRCPIFGSRHKKTLQRKGPSNIAVEETVLAHCQLPQMSRTLGDLFVKFKLRLCRHLGHAFASMILRKVWAGLCVNWNALFDRAAFIGKRLIPHPEPR